MAKLTHEEMHQVLAEGGSVLLNDHAGVGHILSTPEMIPSAATLAEGDSFAEDAVLEANEAQIASLLRQKQQIEDARAKRAQKGQQEREDKSANMSIGNPRPNVGQPGEEQPEGEEPGEHIEGGGEREENREEREDGAAGSDEDSEGEEAAEGETHASAKGRGRSRS